ncbi:MAG TPA: phosphoenolpyruvate--protein phosphotransferase [Balneolaceae bacterium]|nr:phosphoenolpyruvate--protein phosphotransferase [Balneolaceae bacterium]
MNNEISLSGSPGSPGITIGKASLYRREDMAVSSGEIKDGEVGDQIGKFDKARKRSLTGLQELLEDQEDETVIELINTQIEMINDPDLCKRVETEIREHHQPADSAIHTVFGEYLDILKQNQDDLLDRSIDITDIRDRLIQFVNYHLPQAEVEQNTILVAKELSPREVIEFSEANIKGIIMGRGGQTSHAAIIARSMNIPAAVGLKNADLISDGNEVALDGNTGKVIVNPRQSTRQKYEKLIEQQLKQQAEIEAFCAEPNETSDGHSFTLRANIEFAEELDSVQKCRAEGIGLLRTESIYLQREHFGNLRMQETFYKAILEGTKPHPVTIRLFDAGGDKFFEMSQKEQNPFLGWRGVRMLLDEKELLKNQLKAILKTANCFPGRLRILVPMISTLEEVLEVKELMADARNELKEDGITVDEQPPFGVMVEVPSVALQAKTFAEHTDFLSIGTNDLTQYVLAVDRGNELISDLYDQRHPAVWKLLKQVTDAARGKNVPLSVCGELASDPVSACCLMGMGISELSMGTSALPAVKRMLRVHSLKEMQQLSRKVLESEIMDDINRIFREWTQKN